MALGAQPSWQSSMGVREAVKLGSLQSRQRSSERFVGCLWLVLLLDSLLLLMLALPQALIFLVTALLVSNIAVTE